MDGVSFRPQEAAGQIEDGTSQRAAGGKGTSFVESVKGMLASVNEAQLEADDSVEKLLTGKITNIHEVVSSVAKADLSFKLLIQVRNKLLEAYKQTMSMQI